MQLRVTRFKFRPGTLEEATIIAHDALVPGLGVHAECKDAYFATNAAKDEAVAFSLWTSQEAARAPATARAPAPEQLARLMECLVGPPTTEVFEVRAQP